MIVAIVGLVIGGMMLRLAILVVLGCVMMVIVVIGVVGSRNRGFLFRSRHGSRNAVLDLLRLVAGRRLMAMILLVMIMMIMFGRLVSMIVRVMRDRGVFVGMIVGKIRVVIAGGGLLVLRGLARRILDDFALNALAIVAAARAAMARATAARAVLGFFLGLAGSGSNPDGFR